MDKPSHGLNTAWVRKCHWSIALAGGYATYGDWFLEVPFYTGHINYWKAADLAEADDICRNIFILRAHMHRRYDFGETLDRAKVIDNDIKSRRLKHPMISPTPVTA